MIRKLLTPILFGVLLGTIILGCESTQSSTTVSKINDNTGDIPNIGQDRLVQLTNSNLAGAYQDSGIWVTGTGTIKIEPDIAIVTLGVEYSEESLTQARSKTAYSMEQIIKSLKKYSILDRDIQTQSFNIRANYEYVEIKSDISTRTIQKLIGYTVTNKVIIKIRKLEDVGSIIDDSVLLGGDLTRVDNITFDIEDTVQFGDQARVIAVKNAISKAKQYADLTGVKLGSPIYISESGGNVMARDFRGESAMAMASPRSITPILAGQLSIQVSVQMVFQIN